jgi:chemotaxis protein MotA
MRLQALVRAVRGSRPIGFGIVGALVVTLIAGLTGFLDPISLLITLGGPLAVAAATFPRERFARVAEDLRAALAADDDPEQLVTAVKRLARVHRLEGIPALERATLAVSEPFLRRAVALGLEVDGRDDAMGMLCAEARARIEAIEASRQVALTLGRLCPAFGLIGTLIGLALLLRGLDAAKLGDIGPGLGIAVMTTLYGAVLSNVVVLPLATRLQAHIARQTTRLEAMIEGAMLVLRAEYPSQIDRVMRAHLGLPPAPSAATPARPPIALRDHAA